MELSTTLPTLYEHYTAGGITSGLSVDQPYFTLNNKNISIYSGSLHYYRVPKPYWADRLRKFRAAGLNTVETYIPWNLHEPQPGVYDFGNGGSDFQDFLDLEHFLKLAKQEDLFVILRPGPYICGEWEFGGLPSWLLRERPFKVRTSASTFMNHVTRFFNRLLPMLALLQFTKGGPVISFQIENEYGSTTQKGVFNPDRTYLEQLRSLYLKNGINELLFTSDSPSQYGEAGTLPGVLFQTANFNRDPGKEFRYLAQYQPNKPFMTTELWAGWFDHWGEQHHTVSPRSFSQIYKEILSYPASVNIYMFIGGTSFGFMNGANIEGLNVDNKGYQPDTNSYDYDAPLTEIGDYTEKYYVVKQLIEKYNPIKTKLPQLPRPINRTSLPSTYIQEQLLLIDILSQVQEKVRSNRTMAMEYLPINNGSGQSYGYIVYRKENIDISAGSILKIEGRVCDTVLVLVNGQLVSKPLRTPSDLDRFGYWRLKDSTLTLSSVNLTGATLELVVENWGRVNYGKLNQFYQSKGLWQGKIFINDEEIQGWEIVPLEFKKAWNNKLQGWRKVDDISSPKPAIYRTTFTVEEPKDTFVNMNNWTKGIVIINGFVLGRYVSPLGPQLTLYLPAPLQKSGVNEILVFEHFYAADSITFSAKPIFGSSSFIF
ncbi:beta-galactosidase-1-like protein 3 [Agrilus planipennis]|uniref:Beta-galactosidase n=1 Tax=Agrilus planipennis TaxID=224129 RepID=A0A1W4WLM3_AGRPL|nr:beta-galactosidase-1-like protein 3 [Agrilus planipennis]